MGPLVPITLTLSGGGFKGIYYLSVLRRLDDLSDIASIVCYSGCSVGSIIALMHSIGYKADEIISLLCISKVIDDSFEIDVSLRGIINIDKFIGLLRYIVEDVHKLTTLQDHFNATGKTLYLCATDTSDDCKPIYFSAALTPNMKILDAILASIHIPFLFTFESKVPGTYIDGFFSTDNCPLAPTINNVAGYHLVCMFDSNDPLEYEFDTDDNIGRSIMSMVSLLMDQIFRLSNMKAINIINQQANPESTQLLCINTPNQLNSILMNAPPNQRTDSIMRLFDDVGTDLEEALQIMKLKIQACWLRLQPKLKYE